MKYKDTEDLINKQIKHIIKSQDICCKCGAIGCLMDGISKFEMYNNQLTIVGYCKKCITKEAN